MFGLIPVLSKIVRTAAFSLWAPCKAPKGTSVIMLENTCWLGVPSVDELRCCAPVRALSRRNAYTSSLRGLIKPERSLISLEKFRQDSTSFDCPTLPCETQPYFSLGLLARHLNDIQPFAMFVLRAPCKTP